MGASDKKETLRRLDRDGERFLRLFIDEEAGEVTVRFVEPLEVQNPPEKTSADGVYFGIQFARIGETVDVETPLNYFLVNIGTLGESIGLCETVPAGQVQHLKANVDMTWPRGLPTWYALQAHLADAVRTLKATGRTPSSSVADHHACRHINSTREACASRWVARLKAAAGAASGPPGVPPCRDHRRQRRHAVTSSLSKTGRLSTSTWPPSEAERGLLRRPGDAAIHASRRRLQRQLFQYDGGRRPRREDLRGAASRVGGGRRSRSWSGNSLVAAKAGLIRGATEADILDLVQVEAEPPMIKSENRLQEGPGPSNPLAVRVAMSRATMAARHGLVYAQYLAERGGGGPAGSANRRTRPDAVAGPRSP